MEKHTRDKIDSGVLSRLKAGDEAAFEHLYWSYNSHVYNFIKSLLHDPALAEDLTQNVFLKIWERHENIDPEQGVDAYLFTIARHFVYKETDARLKLIFASSASTDLFDRPDLLTEEMIEAESLQHYIDTLIDQLPSARKEIFRLSRRHHLSNKEIGRRLSLSEKTVENQITNALHFLKQKLSEDNHFALLCLLLINGC